MDSDVWKTLARCAQEEGFSVIGGVDLEAVEKIYSARSDQYETWLKDEFFGEMQYLVRGTSRRKNPKELFPELRSVFSVAWTYPAPPAGVIDPVRGVRYARYLRGRDYHLELKERLECVMKQFQALMPDLKWKVCVDTSAVLERTWAALCGLGWIGKNGMLIHPRLGSYSLLGVVFMNISLERQPKLLPDYCGNCRRCLDGCPTEAIVIPKVVDARKCISYLTLEKRGEVVLAEEHKESMANWVAGCDLCQECCPFNTKAAKIPLNEAIAIDVTRVDTWESLLNETEAEYKRRVFESALNRIKYPDFRRNLRWIQEGLTNAKKRIP